MKKIILVFILILSSIVLVSCKKDEIIIEDDGIVVNFETNGGTKIDSITLEDAALIDAPMFPKKDNFIFRGWYEDSEFTNQFDFENDYITGKTTLYAKFDENKTDYKKSFKVLSIGNSFSEDAHKYLFDIAKSANVDESKIVIANMYIGGAELKLHVDNLNGDRNVYTYQKYVDSTMTSANGKKLSEAIKAEDWDVITFQQASHDSGMTEKYGDYLTTLTNWAKKEATNPNVVIGWHMTWAYDQSSTHSGFNNYNKDQKTMFNMIIEAMEKKVFSNPNMSFYIPSGVAVQNARTSYVGDKLTRDGYHLTDPFGRYIAALSYFKAITNIDITKENIKFAPNGLLDEDIEVAFESVNNAFSNPLKETKSINLEEPEREPEVELPNLGFSINFRYQLGFWADKATQVSPETDALHKKFVSTKPMLVGVLPVGSNIVIKEGYQYRIIGFKMVGETLTVTKRSNNISENITEVTEELLADYEYIAFNISPIQSADISGEIDNIASKLSLFHPAGSLLLTNENNELEFDYTLGFWNNNATAISPETDALHAKFVGVYPIYKSQLAIGSEIKIEEGYQYRFIRFELNEQGFKVISRSDLFKADVIVDSTFLGVGQYFGFNIQKIGAPIIEDITEVASKLTIIPSVEETEPEELPDVPHVDGPLKFETGYWEANKNTVTTGDTAFIKGFGVSNTLSKNFFNEVTKIQVEAGYQIRIVFINYDLKGTYTSIKRSANLTGEIDLSVAIADALGKDQTINFNDFEYFAFNISKVPTADLSGNLQELPSKLVFVK